MIVAPRTLPSLGADGGLLEVASGAAAVSDTAALLAVVTVVATSGGRTEGPWLTETVNSPP